MTANNWTPKFLEVERSGEDILNAARQFKSLRYDERGVQVWKNMEGEWQGRTHCWGLLILTAITSGLFHDNICLNLLPYRQAFIESHPKLAEVAHERVLKSLLCHNARRIARGSEKSFDQMQPGDILFFRFGQSTHQFHVALVADPSKRTIIHAIDKSVGRKSKRVDHVYEEPIAQHDYRHIRSLWRLNAVRKTQKSVCGTGRFARLTYGTGEPKITEVLGACLESMDWNGPKHFS